MILPGRRVRKIRLLAAVFILLTAAVSLYGRGTKEDSTLSKADEYINQKEYDQAIQLLSDYLKDNPDQFGAAQKRLQKIVQLREQYNQVANDLLDTLENDPENDQRILELSNLLLTIESPSNPSTRRFLDQVRYLAEFNVNRKKLEGILLAARYQLEVHNFTSVMDIYASGLDIYQNEYFSSGFGQEAEDVASQGLRSIRDNIQRFKTLANPFGAAVRAMTEYCSSDSPNPERAAALYAGLAPYFTELEYLSGSFSFTQRAFAAQLAMLQREHEVGDRSFLSFVDRLINGPSGQNEGMRGTIDRFWRYRIDPADAALMNLVNDSYNSGFTAMINWDFGGGLSAFDEADRYIAAALELVKSWTSFLGSSGGRSYPIYGETVSEEKVGNFLKFRSMNQSIVFLREAGNIGLKSDEIELGASTALSSWRQGVINTATAVSREQAKRDSYQGLINELDILEGKVNSALETIRSNQEELNDIPGGIGLPQSYLTDTRNVVVNLNYRFRSHQLNSIIRLYTVANGDLENRTIAREKEFNEGDSLIQGVSRENAGQGVYMARYPAEGLAALNRMNQNLSADIAVANTLVSQYAGEPQNIRNEEEINALNVSAQNLRARLLSLQSRSTALTATAQTQINRAASLRYEGDRLFQAAQTALNRNDLSAARNNLDRATDQYSASLAIQESDSLRAAWTDQLVALGAEIVRIQNEIVVRDVRNLLNSAQTYYWAGNMEQAESTLVTAQNRWLTTNVTEQPEVVYWLTLVRAGMSSQSGRDISPTAPLYAEMSQLLSDANRNYNEGVRLLSAGRRQDGIARFNEAQEKTREIRLIFPLNHDAMMLELRIEQQLDPAGFTASFQRRLNEAVAGTKVRNQQAYADLQDLAEINPRYPGIQGLLAQAEIDMGRRPPPPDPRNLTRSTELTRNAQVVINARDSIRYEAAMSWLNEAVSLNPSNTQAQTLMDQLSILMGGGGTIVLPPNAKALFDTATQEFLRGNYLTANSIVEQLLQNSEYRKSTQIQELKRRLDTVL